MRATMVGMGDDFLTIFGLASIYDPRESNI